MKQRNWLAIGCCLVAINAFAQSSKNQMRIAFGSCDDQDRPQEMWKEIIAQHPDVWIWGGDNVYSDFKSPAGRKALYNKQKSNTDYQQLIKSCVVTGTWDDHDYGINDGGKNYSLKKESQQLALDFLGFAETHPVRKQEGIYNSMEFGNGKRKVKIINLDTRSFRDTIFRINYIDSVTQKKAYRFEANPTGDVLGEQQWKWLERELNNSGAAFYIINSSIQVLAEEHRFEKWANLPTARKRLLDLINTSKKRIIIISGDRHIAEFSKVDLPNGLPLYEFTSSGLTHTWSEQWVENNRHRIGDLIIEKNFGVIIIEWKNKNPLVKLQSRGLNHQLFNEINISW
jgi:alkaline phosphatase D